MRIATLQFAPKLGAVEQNIQRANTLLSSSRHVQHGQLDLLILPELAFSGYNFPNLEAITPFLEPTAKGISTRWAAETARRLGCYVMVGYPETATAIEGGSKANYNATVTVNPRGDVVGHYRKCFLYYTDETWANEGFKPPPEYLVTNLGLLAQNPPFFCAPIGELNNGRPIGHGICMDINPYRFEAPWAAYEFAMRMITGNVKLVILSMAWLTRLTAEELELESDRPDMETVAYWLERFQPFVTAGAQAAREAAARKHPAAENGRHDPRPATAESEDIVVVFANRCGTEGSRLASLTVPGPHGGEERVEEGDRVCYAGSSCVMRFQGGSVRMYEKAKGEVAILGKGEEGVLAVDTELPARILLSQNIV
jgi:protein N-terminal amidase